MAIKTLSQLVGGTIKSAQRGTVTLAGSDLSKNVTISAVDRDKTTLSYGGSYTNAGADGLVYMTMNSDTNISVGRGNSGMLTVAAWEVIEYE